MVECWVVLPFSACCRAMSSPKVIHSGWLTKRGAVRKSWKNRCVQRERDTHQDSCPRFSSWCTGVQEGVGIFKLFPSHCVCFTSRDFTAPKNSVIEQKLLWTLKERKVWDGTKNTRILRTALILSFSVLVYLFTGFSSISLNFMRLPYTAASARTPYIFL